MLNIRYYHRCALVALTLVAGSLPVGGADAAPLTAAPSLSTSLSNGGFETPNLVPIDWGYADSIGVLYLGRMAAQVRRIDVTQTQVVELITAGRSGDLGLSPAETTGATL